MCLFVLENQADGQSWTHHQADRITPYAWNLGQGDVAASPCWKPATFRWCFPHALFSVALRGILQQRNTVSPELFFGRTEVTLSRAEQCRTAALTAATAVTSFLFDCSYCKTLLDFLFISGKPIFSRHWIMSSNVRLNLQNCVWVEDIPFNKERSIFLHLSWETSHLVFPTNIHTDAAYSVSISCLSGI